VTYRFIDILIDMPNCVSYVTVWEGGGERRAGHDRRRHGC